MKKQYLWSLFILCCSLTLPCAEAAAIEYGVSGFGTLGGAISDNGAAYRRYIDDDGSLMLDSRAGVQLDAKFNDQWAATAQVLLGSSPDDDGVLEPQLKWTLLAYRPTNEWLIRLGRLSLGGLLHQQNMDVGVSYDMVRLPSEVYLISSDYDFDGLSIARTWSPWSYEITLDGSVGMQNRSYRGYCNGSDRALSYSADVTSAGLVLTVSDYDQTTFRAGWHRSKIEPDNAEGTLSRYTYHELGWGLYTLGEPLYESSVYGNSFFLGIRFPLAGFLLSAEATAILLEDFEAAPDTVSAYMSVSRKLGKWTPYLTFAQSWSDGLDTWRKVRGATPVPQLGITQTVIDDAASAIAVFDQNSLMLGTSYAFSPKHKLKAEAMLTHVGERSAMFDGDLAHENVMLYSLSYNFAF